VDDDAGARAGGSQGTETSILGREGPIPQSAAALWWLSTACGPQLRIAAIHVPRSVRSGRPAA